MVCKVSKFINGFTVGIDNVSKAFLGCFSTRNCPEKKDERYQIAESISTESKYFHDFQAIADQFRFLDKTKGTIPKLHCPEEEAERYQESNSCESNYDNGLKTNADQDLSIDLEIKGTNPKLHCPEEEAESSSQTISISIYPGLSCWWSNCLRRWLPQNRGSFKCIRSIYWSRQMQH